MRYLLIFLLVFAVSCGDFGKPISEVAESNSDVNYVVIQYNSDGKVLNHWKAHTAWVSSRQDVAEFWLPGSGKKHMLCGNYIIIEVDGNEEEIIQKYVKEKN